MELLREHVGRTVMESKQSQFWNAVSVAVFTAVFAVLAGILTGYVDF
jgi:ABC-type spermidine/putrescine transport system permease subunit II